jgi:hypothetical protein
MPSSYAAPQHEANLFLKFIDSFYEYIYSQHALGDVQTLGTSTEKPHFKHADA